MFPILVEGPAVEPVSLADMKAYLRVDDDAEDDLIAGLVKAARLVVETASRRVLVAQKWRLLLHAWPPSRSIALPLSPLIAVEKIEVFDEAGIATPLAADAFEVDSLQDPPLVWFNATPEPGRSRHGIAIDFRAGYGPAAEDVPATLRLALKIIVAQWFENRGDVAGVQNPPPEALALIAPFQRPRL
ncbi:hypothetical protein FEZ63_21490 [Microvirga brassicacearum]|uniref:Phage gp6-like head-tail connector protein n=2 Tax=Microvirga brassicacearum TaxID=2580413 RepID=A0A5N3P512_9HYPH|nr:head-tail connector protein [Microvirga brassicacearum]KAB0264793.1 hypothetical protein FEZ63_21490 [Microvirga brassicacearum]